MQGLRPVCGCLPEGDPSDFEGYHQQEGASSRGMRRRGGLHRLRVLCDDVPGLHYPDRKVR